MFKAFAGISPILLAATMVVGAADGRQSTAARSGQTQTDAPVTIVGCVVRNGAVDPDKGTRTLNIAPGALALTSARIAGSGGRSGTAVPSDSDTGTIPQRTIVGRSEEPSTLAFALTGERSAGLNDLVGRRVEVVGRVTGSPDATQARGTTGIQRDAAPLPGAGTREERPAESAAHPSAELRTLEVVSFKGVTGACE